MLLGFFWKATNLRGTIITDIDYIASKVPVGIDYVSLYQDKISLYTVRYILKVL